MKQFTRDALELAASIAILGAAMVFTFVTWALVFKFIGFC